MGEAIFCVIFAISYFWVTTNQADFATLISVKDYPRAIRKEVFCLRVLKERFLFSLIGAILCAVVAVVFVCTPVWQIAVPLAILAAALAVLAFRTSTDYRSARLICDNPILDVGIASVAEASAGGTAESSGTNACALRITALPYRCQADQAYRPYAQGSPPQTSSAGRGWSGRPETPSFPCAAVPCHTG